MVAPVMSAGSQGKDPTKKHRHDIGMVDHGPDRTGNTTRSIQVILGASILLTGALVIYTFWAAGS